MRCKYYTQELDIVVYEDGSIIGAVVTFEYQGARDEKGRNNRYTYALAVFIDTLEEMIDPPKNQAFIFSSARFEQRDA